MLYILRDIPCAPGSLSSLRTIFKHPLEGRAQNSDRNASDRGRVRTEYAYVTYLIRYFDAISALVILNGRRPTPEIVRSGAPDAASKAAAP